MSAGKPKNPTFQDFQGFLDEVFGTETFCVLPSVLPNHRVWIYHREVGRSDNFQLVLHKDSTATVTGHESCAQIAASILHHPQFVARFGTFQLVDCTGPNMATCCTSDRISYGHGHFDRLGVLEKTTEKEADWSFIDQGSTADDEDEDENIIKRHYEEDVFKFDRVNVSVHHADHSIEMKHRADRPASSSFCYNILSTPVHPTYKASVVPLRRAQTMRAESTHPRNRPPQPRPKGRTFLLQQPRRFSH